MTRTRIAVIAVAAATALLVAGLAGAMTSSGAKPHSSGQNLAVSGSVSFDGIWTSSVIACFAAMEKCTMISEPSASVRSTFPRRWCSDGMSLTRAASSRSSGRMPRMIVRPTNFGRAG